MYSHIYNLKNISLFNINDYYKMSSELLNEILKTIFKDKQVLLIPSNDIQEYWFVEKIENNLKFKLGQFYNPSDSCIYEFEDIYFEEDFKSIENYELIKNQIENSGLVYFIYNYQENKFKYELCSKYLVKNKTDLIIQIIKFDKNEYNDELTIDKIFNYDLKEVNFKIDIFYNNQMIYNIVNKYFLNIINKVNNDFDKNEFTKLKNIFKNPQYRKIGTNLTNVSNTKMFNILYDELSSMEIKDLSLEDNYDQLKSQIDIYKQLNYFDSNSNSKYIPQFYWFKNLITKQTYYTFNYKKYKNLNFIPYKISLNVTKPSIDLELTNIKFKRLYLYIGDYLQDKSFVDVTKTGIQNLYFDMNLIKEFNDFNFKLKIVDYNNKDITNEIINSIDNYQIELNILFFQRGW